ncbi:MAG: hypothetical protein ACMG6S_10095 [Byssovorax sp.]
MNCRIARHGNLGDGPQDLRLRMGAVSFALGLVLAVVMLKLGASPAQRLVLAVPFVVGANGLYMGLSRTCTTLAAQGLRDGGDGPTPIVDRAELARVRRGALLVTASALLSGALATSLFVIV